MRGTVKKVVASKIPSFFGFYVAPNAVQKELNRKRVAYLLENSRFHYEVSSFPLVQNQC